MSVRILSSDFYLVVRQKGYSSLGARLGTHAPSLDKGEVAIKLNVQLPETLFAKPQLQATVRIPESAVSAPVIDATVLDNVKEVLEQQTGMNITLRLVEPQ